MPNLYSIHDSKAEQYAPPFLARNNGEATRMFSQAVNNRDDQNMLNKYAEDYTLVYIGEFNNETGVITCDPEIMETVARARNVKEQA